MFFNKHVIEGNEDVKRGVGVFVKELEGISPFDHLQKVNQLHTQTISKPYNTPPP